MCTHTHRYNHTYAYLHTHARVCVLVGTEQRQELTSWVASQRSDHKFHEKEGVSLFSIPISILGLAGQYIFVE